MLCQSNSQAWGQSQPATQQRASSEQLSKTLPQSQQPLTGQRPMSANVGSTTQQQQQQQRPAFYQPVPLQQQLNGDLLFSSNKFLFFFLFFFFSLSSSFLEPVDPYSVFREVDPSAPSIFQTTQNQPTGWGQQTQFGNNGNSFGQVRSAFLFAFYWLFYCLSNIFFSVFYFFYLKF
jgi:hypothetical protein